MKRIALIVALTATIAFMPAKADASPLDPVAARASFGMVVVGNQNGTRFVAHGGHWRSDLFGTSEWLCVDGERSTINDRVSPAVRTTIREEACAYGPSLPWVKYEIDVVNWETAISARIRTRARRETSSWDPRNKQWQPTAVRESPSTTYVTLRWRSSGIWIDPVLHAPICLWFFVVPVPCPSPVGAGLERAAAVSGAISFTALGTRLTLPSKRTRYPWLPSHAIWWDS
jgi:hypothetical protein